MHFAHDLNMQFAADQMGIDPVEFRKISAADPGYVAPAGLVITSCAYKETLDTAAKEIGWYEKKDKLKRERELALRAPALYRAPDSRCWKRPTRALRA